MPGTRRYNDPEPTTAKLTLALPMDLDRRLRALAARRGISVGPMIRGWLVEKLAAINGTVPKSRSSVRGSHK
jgi:hypothetical protein